MLVSVKLTPLYVMVVIAVVCLLHTVRTKAMDIAPNLDSDLDVEPDIEPEEVWPDIDRPEPVQIPEIEMPDPIQEMMANFDRVDNYNNASISTHGSDDAAAAARGSEAVAANNSTQEQHPRRVLQGARVSPLRGLDGMMISPKNKMCNWEAHHGPICRFNKTTEVVVIPAGLMLSPGKLELEIHDAKVVHVYPACVSWVQIFNAELVTTMMDNTNDVGCRTWLRIYGSVADFVVNGVKDLTLIDTEIYTIRLSNQRDFMAINSVIHNIEQLEWTGYRGTIKNTTVGIIRNIVANDNLYVVDSQIKKILSNGILFDSKEFKISNTTVDEVYGNGITVKAGAVTMENVEFNMLHKDAITVVGDTVFLSLIDIVVHNASKPCITLPARGRVSFKNVTINNENITESSSFVHYNEDRAPDLKFEGPIIFAEKNQDGCKVKETQLICNFTDNKEIVKISQERLDEFSSVKIIGSDQLFVDPLCTTDLFLEQVTGTLMHSNMSMSSMKNLLISAGSEISSDHGDEQRPCGMDVSIINSSLDIISCKAIKTVQMENTAVSRLHTGTLNYFNLKNVTIDHLVDNVFNGEESVFENVKVNSLANLIFYGPLKMDLFFAKITLEGSLVFDHPNKTSVMRNIHFRKLFKGSILVRSGTLEIYDCFITSVEPMSIIIEDEGNLKLVGCFFLSVAEHVVSVAREDQAFIPHLTSQFLHIRSNSSTSGHNFTVISSANPHCLRKALTWFLFCDFAGTNSSLDIKLKTRQMIIINNVYSIDIYPSLLIKLILHNVEKATTIESEDDYSFWLEGNNVTFDRISTGVHDITLRHCRIKLLSPDRELVDIDLEHTVVDKILGLSWKGYEGVFNNVTIGEINAMQVYGMFTMHVSHVEYIRKDGIKINDNGNIINSTLCCIASGGIKVTGHLQLIDVVIDNMERESIVVSGGTLLLKNVIIKNATENSIMAINKGGISFQNVTIGGSDIVMHGYFTNIGSEENPNNHSFILHNKPNSVKITDAPLPSTKSSTTKSTVGPPSQKSPTELYPSFSKDPRLDEAETNAQSWGWAGAGTGFLCGILVGCAVFMVLKLIRSRNGHAFLPLVLWQVKDDQSGLLTTESTRNSVIQDGYTTVPHTEDRL